MAKFHSAIVLLALTAVALGTPAVHPMLGRHVPFRGNEVGYHVSIQVLDWWNDIPKHICSGTLLRDHWVLTTANCIHQAFDNLGKFERVTIQGGEANLQGYYESHTDFTVVHNDSDIGLIKIQQPMRESYCCSFASLPTKALKPGEVATGVLTGQSTNDKWALELAESVFVQATDSTRCGDLTDVAPHSLCSVIEPVTSPAPEPTTSEAPVEPSTSDAPVDPSTSDAPADPRTSDAPVEPSTSDATEQPTTSSSAVQNLHSSKPTCFADIGGPLVQNGVVVGLISRGSGCVSGPDSTVLTDVSAFTTWIQDTIVANGVW